MDILVPSTVDDYPIRPMGRDTELTLATRDHWQALIPEAPQVFSGASDSVQVSPPLWKYCIGGYDNQDIGMCVGKATKNAAGTLLRIPAGATYDPARPDAMPAAGPNIRLSGLYCYWDARNVHGRPGMGEGAVVAYSLDGIKQYGLLPESLWPDTSENQRAYSDRRAPSQAMRDAAAPHRVVQAFRITSRKQYLDYLAQGYPIVDGVAIPQGWMRTSDDGQFTLRGRVVGGHATETTQYDMKLDRLYKRNSWYGWGMTTDDPEFRSDDPAYGGNAGGRNNVGYCSLQEYLDRYLTDGQLASGETDAFVLTDVPGFARPRVALASSVDVFA